MKFSRKFVCEDREFSTFAKNIPAPLFRKSLTLEKEPSSAAILICGLGFYEIFVNGKRITKSRLAPYISNPDHYLYYDRYDLLPYLTKGENIIGVMLGDGFTAGKTVTWDFKDNITNDAPMMALEAEIHMGEEYISFDATSFVCKKGPILFNDLRAGVFYDARLEEKGWNAPGYHAEGWHDVISVRPPRGLGRVSAAEPITVTREIKPISIRRGELDDYAPEPGTAKRMEYLTPFEKAPVRTGGYIYDFGENNSGIYRLKIRGTRGQRIDIQCGEQLVNGKMSYANIHFYPDGFSQRDLYTLSGEGEEIYEPMFTFHGYRYIYISGITEEQATEELLTYLVMSSELPERGSFRCSDPVVNQIYEMGRRSDISNFFYFPMDCPHREKNGWTGDASISAEHMIMTIGAEKSWREWLYNIRAAQRENGMLPGIVPTDKWGYSWGNGPAWDSVLFNLPYFAYRYRGDTRIIEENASAMLRYLEYISKRRDEGGLLDIGLGDWVPVGKQPPSNYDVPRRFTDSVMVVDICRKASVMFEAIGLNLHKQFADSLASELLPLIRRDFIDFDSMTIKSECQSGQAIGIFFDIFEENEKQAAFDSLMKIIERDGKFITSGFLGLRTLFHVLADFGQIDLAYYMITRPEYPSYGNWARRGETTLLEHFLPYDQFYKFSKNHHFLGDVVNWFMSDLGGLHVTDCKTVAIEPHFAKALDWCETSHSLPGGNITIRWERKDKKITLTVKTEGDVDYTLKNADNYKKIADGIYEIN